MENAPSIEKAVQQKIEEEPSLRLSLINLVEAWQVVTNTLDATEVSVLDVSDQLVERVEEIVGIQHERQYENRFMLLVKITAKATLQ